MKKNLIYLLLLFSFPIFLQATNENTKIKLPSISQDLIHNWFNKETGNWEISFFDTLAIFKDTIWNYNEIDIKNDSGYIKLDYKNHFTKLYLQKDKSGACLIGESPGSLQAYCTDSTLKPVKDSAFKKPYELPLFKIDSAKYSGYLKNYNAQCGKNLTVYIDDIITGKQNSYLISISENGFFSASLPVYYPHLVWIRSNLYNGSVFLEPGKKLFQMIERDGISLFMGESARINTELTLLEKVNSVDFLDSIVKANSIGVKAYQVKKLEIEYTQAVNKIENGSYYESDSKKKNNSQIQNADTIIEFNSYINLQANNPLAVLSLGYNIYITRLRFSDLIPNPTKYYSNYEIAVKLEESGYSFSKSERELLAKLKEIDSLENSPEQKEFRDKYEQLEKEFLKKYRDSIPVAERRKRFIDYSSLENILNEKRIHFTNEESKLLKTLRVNYNSQVSVNIRQLHTTFGDSIRKFNKVHHNFMMNIYIKERVDTREAILKQNLGIQKGFATDIMIAQNYCDLILNDFSPLNDGELNSVQKQISTPFIADYISFCNHQLKSKLQAKIQKTGFAVNEVPKTDLDKLFDNIMKKYKGKVVLVDFWATWCGPCRMGIERIKSVKAEMEGKDVVFVYITDQSSPETTWKNFIPDIKGEHYKVSTDEWNYFSSQFNISGIPHYVLVGKSGKVINSNLGQIDNESLKAKFDELLKE
jgi:thiol-disulfide isomerase/thioredoxin